MGHLRIRHLARTNRNALGGKGFGGNIISHMAGRSLPFQCFHSPVRFLFFFFSEPWKIRRPLQLSLTPTLTLHTWISFHFFGGRQRSPLGLYHSLHNHLRHPDYRRPGKKREACRCRSCPWLLTGITEQGNGKLSTSFLGGIPRCSRLCPWENGRNACVKHCFVVHLRSLSHALEHLFLLRRGCSAFWPARFSTSSRPIVIFRLISFRLVLHDRFFFFIFVFSLFLFCLPRNAFTFVLYYLAILAKHINISPSASDGMRVLSLCLQSSWHIRTCTRCRS